jgi:hypothetical protein
MADWIGVDVLIVLALDYGDPRLPERFWDKVYPCPVTGCWLWGAAMSGCGYGQLNVQGRRLGAHRFAYSAVFGVPVGLDVDHLCRVRPCVNPEHMESVPHRENVRRGKLAEANRRRRGESRPQVTRCRRFGHLYTPETTWTDKYGRRTCKECRRVRVSEGA